MTAGARQRGLVTVELAMIGAAMLITLMGCIEIGRALYVWNSLNEATRRGARLAAVCPVNHAAIAQVTTLNAPGGGDRSPFMAGLTTANVTVEYLGEGGAATTVIGDMRFVRVAITGYQHTLMIPFLAQTIAAPSFQTTVPVESLGYVPELDERQCFGT